MMAKLDALDLARLLKHASGWFCGWFLSKCTLCFCIVFMPAGVPKIISLVSVNGTVILPLFALFGPKYFFDYSHFIVSSLAYYHMSW